MPECNAEVVFERFGRLTSFPIVSIECVPIADASDSASALRPVVLVVDDGCGIADGLAEMLSLNGYAAMPAYGAESALEMVQVVPPEMIVIDSELFGDGAEYLARSLGGTVRDCKIVLISGDMGSTEVLARMKAAQRETEGDAKETAGLPAKAAEGLVGSSEGIAEPA